jgi:hypothetical protein
VVAMTRYGGILRITLDAGIVGRGHAKIADRGHVQCFSSFVGMFTCTPCIIKGRKNREKLHLVRSAKTPVCVFIVSSFVLS